MPLSECLQVCEMVSTSLEIKRSQFIAYAVPLRNLADVENKLTSIRAKQPAARHHVYAWRFYDWTSGQQYAKFSDDGEPSQTAGAPLFHVLQESQVNNTLLVVSRIFGGILLGAGGLVRAYSKAGTLVLQVASYEKIVARELVCFTLDYAFYDQFCYYARKQNWHLLEPSFSNAVCVNLAIQKTDISVLEQFLSELCGKNIAVQKLGVQQIALPFKGSF